jgi:NCAIR mutase (PurE)-related protein
LIKEGTWMNLERIRKLLEDIKEGRMEVDAALEFLRDLPYEDIGFAKIDSHRPIRSGIPEVVFCPGKEIHEIVSIVERLASKNHNIMATRANDEIFREISRRDDKAVFYERARIIVANPKDPPRVGKVAVVSAGTSDIPVAEEAAVTAEVIGSNVDRIYDVGVAGIHRLFDNRHSLLDANVIVVVAGMEGALASVVGGLVNKPVIAVPTSIGYGASFNGIAALLSMLNSCVPWVSVVNIDNGFGAGCQAHLINSMGTKNRS